MSHEDASSPLDRIRSSFSLKLLLLFLSVFVVIAAIGGVVYLQTGDAVAESTEDNMVQFTTLQADATAQWVDRTRDRTQYIAASNDLQSEQVPRIEARLGEEYADSPSSVAAIHYVDLEARSVLASSERTVEEDAYRDAGVEWIEDGVEYDGQKTALTYPYEDPVTGEQSVAFVSDVPDADGAVVLVVDLATQTDQFDRPGTTNASFTHVVDDRGTIVMSHEGSIGQQNMGDPDEHEVNSMGVHQGLQGETGFTVMDMGHHGEMAMGFTRVEGTDWVIMTHVPTDEAYALATFVRYGVGGLLLAALLGLGAVGLVVGRNTTSAVENLAEQARRLENGDLDAEFESDRVDEIGQLYGAFEAMRLSLRDRLRELEATRQEIATRNEHLESKADEYSQVMATCADGDLTQRMDASGQNQAMSQIAHEFNRMVAELERTTEQIATFASDVAASTEEVNASAEEVRSASEQVTESIQEISDGAERQHENLRETNQEMSSLSTATEEIAATSNEVADLAERTADAARDGRTTAEAAIQGMDEIGDESEAAVEEIEALEAEIEQIDELVEFIEELAEQTNVLALNASIEASRKHDQEDDGGFAVVADEVKQLADETKEATDTIEQRIQTIKAQSDRTVEEVQETSDRVAQHREKVTATLDSLADIASYAEETSDGVQEISAATEQQAASTQEVVAMVEEATAISEETTSETENVAAAGEEQTTSLTEVSHAINRLADHATQLSAELDEFETNADVDPDQPFADQADGDDSTTDSDAVPAAVGGSGEYEADDFDAEAPDESVSQD